MSKLKSLTTPNHQKVDARATLNEAIAEWQAELIAEHADKMYEAGWNSALEMAAFKLQNDFKHSFGENTLKSISIWMKDLKK